MERIIETYNYGLCAFSIDTMKDFLKERKIRSKKLLDLFQKKKELFLETIETGTWFPIPSINSGEYVISVEGFDEPFGEEWTEVLSYEGFHLHVKNGFWITDIGEFLKFEESEFQGEGREVVSPYGTVDYFSDKEKWNKDLSGKISYSAYWYDVPEGKYSITITGYARKDVVEDKNNYGFQFKLKKVEEFMECKNPREEAYEFNIDWIYTTKTATVYWLPQKESGIQWPLKEKQHKNSIIIPFENDKKVYLLFGFELSNQTEE